MTTEYYVRNYCEECAEMKRTIQIDIVDPDWQNSTCVTAGHTVRIDSFVIEKTEEVP